jgi:hypothetical protein
LEGGDDYQHRKQRSRHAARGGNSMMTWMPRTPLNRAATGVAGVAALAAIAAGFAVLPPRRRAVGVTSDLGSVPLMDDLPTILAEHLDPDGDGQVPRMDTAVLWGRAKLRLGRSPWLAARMVTRHRVGRDFASEIDLTWYGRTVLHVVDAYVGGHGIAGDAARPEIGVEIDQGANLFLWCEAALIPSAFAAGSPVRAQQEQDGTIRLDIPLGPTTTNTAWLRFENGHPRRFSAPRYKGVGGERVWWHVDMYGWQPVDGIWLPERIVVTWQDEGRPWFRLDIDGYAANVHVDEHFGRGGDVH